MCETTEYRTKEEFARSFIPTYKQALKLIERKARGEKVENNTEEWLKGLIAEAEEMKIGGA